MSEHFIRVYSPTEAELHFITVQPVSETFPGICTRHTFRQSEVRMKGTLEEVRAHALGVLGEAPPEERGMRVWITMHDMEVRDMRPKSMR